MNGKKHHHQNIRASQTVCVFVLILSFCICYCSCCGALFPLIRVHLIRCVHVLVLVLVYLFIFMNLLKNQLMGCTFDANTQIVCTEFNSVENNRNVKNIQSQQTAAIAIQMMAKNEYVFVCV